MAISSCRSVSCHEDRVINHIADTCMEAVWLESCVQSWRKQRCNV